MSSSGRLAMFINAAVVREAFGCASRALARRVCVIFVCVRVARFGARATSAVVSASRHIVHSKFGDVY